jgi:hypothetical protein
MINFTSSKKTIRKVMLTKREWPSSELNSPVTRKLVVVITNSTMFLLLKKSETTKIFSISKRMLNTLKLNYMLPLPLQPKDLKLNTPILRRELTCSMLPRRDLRPPMKSCTRTTTRLKLSNPIGMLVSKIALKVCKKGKPVIKNGQITTSITSISNRNTRKTGTPMLRNNLPLNIPPK